MDEEYDQPQFFVDWDPGTRAENLLTEAIGIEGKAGLSWVLLRHTELPATYSGVLRRDRYDKETGQVKLIAGDISREGDRRPLGKLSVPDLSADESLPVWVIADELGVVTVVARHPGTGEIFSGTVGSVAIEPNDSNRNRKE
jgi:hypothetical protein